MFFGNEKLLLLENDWEITKSPLNFWIFQIKFIYI